MIGIFAVAEALHHLRAVQQRIVHAAQKLPVHQIVGVKYAHRIKAVRQDQLVHHLRQHLALAADRALRAKDLRAVPRCDGLGVVGAVVGRNDHLIQCARIILPAQAVYQLADHRRLVARRHHKGKALLGRPAGCGAGTAAQAEQRNHCKVNAV